MSKQINLYPFNNWRYLWQLAALNVYLDDIIVTGNDKEEIGKIEELFSKGI